MIIEKTDGFVIWEVDIHNRPSQRSSKTSVIQVRRYVPSSNAYIQLAQFQYLLKNLDKRLEAIQKARDYITNYKKL